MAALFALFQIVLIDLSLAGDNAVVIGVAVAALPAHQRKRAMMLGIAGATVLRIVMALFATRLLHVAGLLAAGGILLLWVGWKMGQELRALRPHKSAEGIKHKDSAADKLSTATWQIIIADFSMSLDNVLGVAGVARDHIWQLVFGLCLSVALMGLASSQIAKLATRYPKIGYAGVAIVLYVALHMIYDGVMNMLHPIPGLA